MCVGDMDGKMNERKTFTWAISDVYVQLMKEAKHDHVITKIAGSKHQGRSMNDVYQT